MRYDWMSDGTYEGIEERGGVEAYKWNKVGLQNNFYWETKVASAADRIPIATDMGAGTN